MPIASGPVDEQPGHKVDHGKNVSIPCHVRGTHYCISVEMLSAGGVSRRWSRVVEVARLHPAPRATSTAK